MFNRSSSTEQLLLGSWVEINDDQSAVSSYSRAYMSGDVQYRTRQHILGSWARRIPYAYAQPDSLAGTQHSTTSGRSISHIQSALFEKHKIDSHLWYVLLNLDVLSE
jgi:hypothetical protein